jgi:hypothetical protein
MCRQLLVRPSSAAETSQPHAVLQPNFDPDITVGELERQIRHHVDLLRARLEDIRLPIEFIQAAPQALPTVDDELVRNEFSGMYS